MENHLQLTDLEFESQFECGSLPPSVFNHEAHIRLAWIHIKKYGVDQAIQNVCAQLQHYVSLLGAADKYNKTLTVAAVRVVHHFMIKAEYHDFQNFITANPRLIHNFKDLMFQHYRTDIFSSEEAKQKYLEPELLPFD